MILPGKAPRIAQKLFAQAQSPAVLIMGARSAESAYLLALAIVPGADSAVRAPIMRLLLNRRSTLRVAS